MRARMYCWVHRSVTPHTFGAVAACPWSLLSHCLFGDAEVDELAQHLAALQFDVTLIDFLKLDVA